jgi:hypothetical protein
LKFSIDIFSFHISQTTCSVNTLLTVSFISRIYLF